MPTFEELLKQGGKLAQPQAPRFDDLVKQGGTVSGAPPPSGPTSSAGGAALRGFGQGLTAEFGDELGAALQAGLQKTANVLPAGALEWAGIDNRYQQDPAEVYRRARAENRAQLEADIQQHPGYAIGGNVAGGIVQNLALPGSALTGGAGVLRAGAQGAAMGLGASEADLTQGQVAGAGADVLLGTALGAAGQAVGEGVGRVAPHVAQWVQRKAKDFSALRALNAAGYFKQELKPIIKRGGTERAVQMGTTLLEEPGVIRAGAGVESVLEGVESARAEWGQVVGDMLDEADAAGARFDIVPMAKRVMNEVIAPKIRDPVARPNVQKVGEILAGYLEEAKRNGGLTFRQASDFKTTLQQEGINWGNHWNNYGPTHHQQKYELALQGIFADEIDNQLGRVLGPDAYDAFKEAKAKAGVFIDAHDKAKNLNAALQGNAQVSLKDLGVGAVAGGGLPGFAATLASKVGRERGASVLARAGHGIAKSSALEAIAKASPESFGRYSGAVAAALARGPESLAALDKVLRDTSSEWREMREKQESEARR